MTAVQGCIIAFLFFMIWSTLVAIALVLAGYNIAIWYLVAEGLVLGGLINDIRHRVGKKGTG